MDNLSDILAAKGVEFERTGRMCQMVFIGDDVCCETPRELCEAMGISFANLVTELEGLSFDADHCLCGIDIPETCRRVGWDAERDAGNWNARKEEHS